LALALSACSDETGLMDCNATLLTDEPVLDLGRVFLGASARGSFNLTSPGCTGTTYRTALELDAFGWQVGPAVGNIAANTGVEIVVVFRPGRAGPSHARAVFTPEGSETASVTVDLFGNGTAIPDCEDGNGCTVDEFNLDSGECEHRAERLVCDDFNSCTGSDLCVEGVCLGESFSCDDNNVCTDDLCDPRTGCTNILTSACSDGNPCTLDSCDPVMGCQHNVLDDGTPCNDLEQCTIGDICIRGECIGATVPEGAVCDDGDPCSKNDQCVEGTCLDPGYHRPGTGELKYVTEVGQLAEGAEENPIIDRDGSVYVGIEGGVTALDLCGEVLWTNTALGTPRWQGAVSIPGVLSVPIGEKIVDIDARTGMPLRELDARVLFTGTASSGARVLDLAIRASGGLVVSVISEIESSSVADTIERAGMIAEVDPFHLVITPAYELGARHASRVAIDNDEAIVTLLREGAPDKGVARELVVRFGLAAFPNTTWSSSDILARRTQLAFGPGSEVLWSNGLISLTKNGEVRTLYEPIFDTENPLETGSPVTFMNRALIIEKNTAIGSSGWGGLGFGDRLLAIDLDSGEVVFRSDLVSRAKRMSPAVDLAGTSYVLTEDGMLRAFDLEGAPFFAIPLPLEGDRVENVALGITPGSVVVGISAGRVFGVQSEQPLANSSWPRHRRDNLSTGHK
jgi:hypothetical protein